MAYAWKDFCKSVVNSTFEFPHLKVCIIAQASLECGFGATKLFSEHGNPFGMHYHDFLKDLATAVDYQAHDGLAKYCHFETFENAVKAYWRWFDYWEHYGDWRLAAKKTALDFLNWIGPHYCPPGFTQSWKDQHGGLTYAQYIVEKCYPRAEKDYIDAQGKPPLNDLDAKKILIHSSEGEKIRLSAHAENLEPIASIKTSLMNEMKTFLERFKNAVSINPAGNIPFPNADQPSSYPQIKEWPANGIIPFAKQYPKRMKTRGAYQGGNASGVLLHHSASKPGPGIIDYGLTQGYAYLCIDRDGTLYQAHDIREWGYHAGNSAWKGLEGGVTDDLIGIEVVSAGRLSKVGGKLYAWWDFDENGKLKANATPFPESECVYCDHTDDDEVEGWYQKITSAQFMQIVATCAYLLPRTSKQILVSHYECAIPKGRKNDIMGMEITMSQLRDLLRKQYGLKVIP